MYVSISRCDSTLPVLPLQHHWTSAGGLQDVCVWRGRGLFFFFFFYNILAELKSYFECEKQV